MLAVFSGSDTLTVRQKAYDLLVSLEEKGATQKRFEVDAYTPHFFEDLSGGTSLFGETYVYLLDMFSENDEAYEALHTHLDALQASTHTFIVIEKKLLKKQETSFKKHAEIFEVHNETGKKESFNVFALTDAYLRKDKKSLWIGLQRAKEAGVAGENIIGTLSWQVKMLRLSFCGASASAVEMKPFVYSKAKRAHGVYQKEEVTEHARQLIEIYHDAHRGICDIDESLERWVLNL